MPFRHASGDRNDPVTYRHILAVVGLLAVAAGLALNFWPALRSWFA